MSGTSSISDDDMSSFSGHEDYDYETDCTTPAPSCSGEHIENEEVESFRAREYPQLAGKIYLDHGGSTLYAKSMVEDFSRDLISNLYGNPHSDSTPSAIAGHRIDAIREKALRFFKADPEKWDLVFVANATAAIKLTIECIKDHAASTHRQLWYGYHRDAHTSLVGVRELTTTNRCFASDDEVEKWIECGGAGGPLPRQLGLFAYPGQSNMTGRRLPLTWPGMIKKKVLRANTYTLLDAAALASTAQLDLSNTHESPDFVALSFYKIFGFPNIGALLVQKSSSHVLTNRKYFGGGTVDMVVTINDTWHARKTASTHDALEDGTLPFHSIFALDHAINVHERLYGSEPMKFISRHTAQLSRQLYDNLCNLRHRNGKPVIRIYKESSTIYGDSKTQGATIAFNVLKSDGSLIPYTEVEKSANGHNIYIRSGSLCNPGGMATYLNWTPAEMKAAFASGHRCSNPTEIVDGKATGVVRVSLGGMSTASDIRALISFLRASYVDTTTQKTTTSLAKQPLSLQRASFIKIQIPEEREMDAVVAATAPVIGTPTYRPPPVVRNRLRKSFDFSVGPSPGSSVTSISSAGLPRSQSSNLIGLRPKPNISRRRSLLSGSTSKPVVGKWDNFWKEETAALVAAGAVESEVKPITSSADTKKKEKERSGFRKVARALTLSRRHD
ncbi:PLP-dependent transferase [Aureobasidium sp. EXF-3400]|nr:PLP-dependent transferase [Aureobasidium sp. EXF-3400]